jgi:hypothetical protein
MECYGVGVYGVEDNLKKDGLILVIGLHLPDLHRRITNGFRAFQSNARSPTCYALYPISVRQIYLLHTTFFRFPIARNTLVFC